MGLDLTLAPIRYPALDWWLASERIALDSHYDLFGLFAPNHRGKLPAVCHPQPLPKGKRFEWYEDEGITTKTTDPYGTPLTYIRAGETKAIEISDTSEWNRAVLLMVQNMPPDTPIVLWWH